MAEGETFTMTAAHLARTMEAARRKERERIAKYLDDNADHAFGEAENEVAAAFQRAAEYVRSMGTDAPRVTVAADPLDVLRDGPPSDGLPPVQPPMDDFEEGSAIARNLGARGRLNLPRD